MFNIEHVYKVYSGKVGSCMCGCAGKWSYTAKGAVDHNPGYDVSDMVNERSVKIIAGKIMRDPNVQFDEFDDGCVFVEQNGRVLVAYFC